MVGLVVISWKKQNFLAARLKRRYAAFAHIKTKHSNNNNKKHCYKGAHSSREGETERLSLAKISNKKNIESITTLLQPQQPPTTS